MAITVIKPRCTIVSQFVKQICTGLRKSSPHVCVESFCCKVVWSKYNIRDGWKGDDCEEVLEVWQIWIVWAFALLLLGVWRWCKTMFLGPYLSMFTTKLVRNSFSYLVELAVQGQSQSPLPCQSVLLYTARTNFASSSIVNPLILWVIFSESFFSAKPSACENCKKLTRIKLDFSFKT